ncbi:hypothetical protein K0M31_012536 [Melipona bicolor]|uniref:Uncharacterized protein n=1 Tax=Melipona bicolor TaxID=60889 RepID=A0AA40FJJ7_9HYME|nr:hypothetical protein K0M31_012536 [Melipona bicolor]
MVLLCCSSFVTQITESDNSRETKKRRITEAIRTREIVAVISISRATDGPTFWAGPPLRNDGGSRTNKHRPIAPLCSKRLKLRSPPRLNLTESVSNRSGEWNGKAHAWFTDFAVSHEFVASRSALACFSYS